MKLLTIVSSVRVIGVIVTSAVLFASKSIRAEPDDSQHVPVVQTESGAVVGKVETLPLGKSVYEYLGIPYAEPPVGELRFAAPKPVKPWSDVRRTTKFGASCVQPSLPGITSDRNNEDCLFLNVFVPSTIKPDDKMAGMVWIHGGAYSLGSSTDYPGAVLAAFSDVIVVTLNYRLGVLGFFNIPGTDIKGNYGILDQVLAFKWVQTNIASFGGDPNKVTIFGESAGGMSVSLHLVSPMSKGLFRRAIMQSGASSSPMYCGKVAKPKQLELFAKVINCSLGPGLIDCVRGKDVEDILYGQVGISRSGGSYSGPLDIIGPTVDGGVLLDLPEVLFKTGQFHPDVDVITGFTTNEGALLAMIRPPGQFQHGVDQQMFESVLKGGMLYAREKNEIVEDLALFEYTNHEDPDNKFSIRRSLMDCLGDSAFVSPALLEATALAKGGAQTYVYAFDHRPVYSQVPEWMGVAHAMDIPFVFGAPFRNISEPFVEAMVTRYSEIEKGLSLHVMKMWTDFAKYGSPNPPDSGPQPVTWPKYTEQEQEYLVLDLKPRVEKRFRAEKVAFWNEVVPILLEHTKTDKLKHADEERMAQKDEL